MDTIGSDQLLQPGEVTFGFAVSKDGGWASITAAGGELDDSYVDLVEHRQGVGWLPGRLVELIERWEPIAIGCNSNGPSGAQVAGIQVAMQRADIDVTLLKLLTPMEYKNGCGGFYTDSKEGRLTRPAGQAPMDQAGLTAGERKLGDAWAWAVRDPTVPITPLEAATIARALLPAHRPQAKPTYAY